MSRLVVVSDFHASKRRPKLEEITIAWRGGYGYVTGHLPGEEQLPLCRAALSRPGHRLGLRALPGQQPSLRRRSATRRSSPSVTTRRRRPAGTASQ